MIATDEDALICDLAETYRIYDYKSLPVQRVAVFCVGLREDSRIKRKISGSKYPVETMLLASATDYMALLWWAQTKDGQKGINRPVSVLNALLGSEQEREIMVFDTAEDFEKKRREIAGKGEELWN